MGKIYDTDGWVNWDYLYNENRFIMAVTGSRGTGKTYGLLKFIIEHKIRFVYLRRLKSQLDQCCTSDSTSNPFQSINHDLGLDIKARKSGSRVIFYTGEKNDSEIVGYGDALSIASTVRGVDMSDVDVIVFDEFIAKTGERPIKNEAAAFNDYIETVNRNRELKGSQPVQVFMLGNANKLMNPYYVQWHFMKTALRMIRGNQMMYRTADNRRIMVMLLDSPISKQKAETALYKDNDNTDFIKMALDNAFATDETTIQSHPLTDCRHIVSIGDIGIYQLKSTGRHYISETVNRSNYLDENDINIRIFRVRYAGLKTLFLYGSCEFENYDCELIFREFIGL